MAAFKLPDLGEGLHDAELVEWLVKEGEHVQLDQIVLLVETAKALVELPAPSEGVITKLRVSAGQTVKVGQILFEYEKSHEQQGTRQPASLKKESVSVVGELTKTDDAKNNLFEVSGNADLANSYSSAQFSRAPEKNKPPEPVCITRFKESRTTQAHEKKLIKGMTPAAIAFAKKLGIYDQVNENSLLEQSSQSLLKLYTDHFFRGPEQSAESNEPTSLKGARKMMAQEMTKAHQQIPMATLFEDADISHWQKKEDITVSLIQAMSKACQTIPILNAWYDKQSMTVQKHEQVDLGLAMNNEADLFVPVIHNANTKSAKTLRSDIDSYQHQVNDRSIKAKDLIGATISLSNFGALSGRYATPIILPPQVCIIGVGKIREAPIVKEGKIRVGKIMPISLSFDHRVATGAEAANFMQVLIGELEGRP